MSVPTRSIEKRSARMRETIPLPQPTSSVRLPFLIYGAYASTISAPLALVVHIFSFVQQQQDLLHLAEIPRREFLRRQQVEPLVETGALEAARVLERRALRHVVDRPDAVSPGSDGLERRAIRYAHEVIIEPAETLVDGRDVTAVHREKQRHLGFAGRIAAEEHLGVVI